MGDTKEFNELAGCIDSTIEYSIECCICGDRDEVYDGTEARYAKELFEEGWRYLEGGATCPKCRRLMMTQSVLSALPEEDNECD